MARCKLRSNGWKKARLLVSKLHKHIFNQRNDFHHKLSHKIINEYGFIAVEDLNIKGLAAGWLAKSIHDASWGSFMYKLTYKAESAGRELVKVNARGTSQQCVCGASVPKKLWNRTHECNSCGLKTSRDHASALEILGRGLRLRALTEEMSSVALEL